MLCMGKLLTVDYWGVSCQHPFKCPIHVVNMNCLVICKEKQGTVCLLVARRVLLNPGWLIVGKRKRKEGFGVNLWAVSLQGSGCKVQMLWLCCSFFCLETKWQAYCKSLLIKFGCWKSVSHLTCHVTLLIIARTFCSCICFPSRWVGVLKGSLTNHRIWLALADLACYFIWVGIAALNIIWSLKHYFFSSVENPLLNTDQICSFFLC